MNNPSWLLVWYLTGMLCSLYWPYKLRDRMKPNDWKIVFTMMWIHGFFGPFAVLTSFPI